MWLIEGLMQDWDYISALAGSDAGKDRQLVSSLVLVLKEAAALRELVGHYLWGRVVWPPALLVHMSRCSWETRFTEIVSQMQVVLARSICSNESVAKGWAHPHKKKKKHIQPNSLFYCYLHLNRRDTFVKYMFLQKTKNKKKNRVMWNFTFLWFQFSILDCEWADLG